LALETKQSLSFRIVSAQRFLARILDSFWFSLASVFSKFNAPSATDKDKAAQDKLGTESKSKAPTWHKYAIRTLEWAIAFGASLLTIAGFFLPKVSVNTSTSLQATNPMKSVFSLSNDGLLPIHDIIAVCQLEKFKAGNFQMLATGEGDGGFTFPESHGDILSPGHHMTLPCAHLIGVDDTASITEAEMTIILTYRPDFVWWHRKAKFPFKAEKTMDASWIWKSLPR
jgi:hypothetical protein